jgi:hypothetical protein
MDQWYILAGSSLDSKSAFAVKNRGWSAFIIAIAFYQFLHTRARGMDEEDLRADWMTTAKVANNLFCNP